VTVRRSSWRRFPLMGSGRLRKMSRIVARTVALLLGLALALGPGAGRADDSGSEDEELSLASLLAVPEEVWTASKTEQKNNEAPAIITTVTRDQIAVWGYRSVAEVLSHLLGFYVVDDHSSVNLAVRGISGGLYSDSSIVKVLIDGHSVAFHSTGGNWLGPELVPLSAIERIEIVRGPASALFGADAFLGVINIKTRRGSGLNGAAAWLSAGRVGRRAATDMDVSTGLRRGNLDILLAARRTSQDLSGLELPASSPAPSLPEHRREARHAQGLDQDSTSALLRLTYHPRAGTELGGFAYYSSMRRGVEFGSLFQLANGSNAGILSENRVDQSQLRAGLFLHQTFAPSLRLSVQGSGFRGAPGRASRLEVGSEFYYVRRDFGFLGADLDAQLEWTPAWAAGRLRVVTGASGFVDNELLPSRIGIAKQVTEDGQPGDVIDSISVYQAEKIFLNSGAYLQGMWNAGSLLSLTGGLRYDRHNVYGGQISERVGLVSNPLPILYAKLLYGSAFKAPSPTLLHAIPSAIGDVVGNPQLKPQRVRTVELQVGWEPTRLVSVSSGLAYSVLSNKTEFVQQGINQVARNVARAGTLSWETLAELKYQNLLRAHLSFEAQRTVRRTGQEGYSGWVVGSDGGIYPSTMVHAGVVAQPSNLPLRAAVQASYIGRRRPSDTNILLADGVYHLPAYLLLEAGLATPPFDLFGRQRNEIAFALTGKNLLGAGGPTPGFSGVDYPLSPRAFLLQMNLTL
jgi:outer membrane receptor for ferrienterochelin and colicins